MTPTSGRFNFHLTKGALLYALAMLATAVVILGAIYFFIGPHSANAGYLAILFLLSPARAFSMRMRLLAAGWAVLVAIAGYSVGPLGFGAILAGLVVVSLVQALFKVAAVSSVNRAPVNFVAFAALGTEGNAQLWMVALGSVVGAAFVVGLSTLLPKKNTAAVPKSLIPMTTFQERMEYGFVLAIGAVIILGVSDFLGFPFAEWALLSYCMILSANHDSRTSLTQDRVLGTVLGAILGTLAVFLPEPIPIIVAVVVTILAVAYLRMGNFTLFTALLTPAVMITSTTEFSTVVEGEGRIISVLAAAALAFLLSSLASVLSNAARARTLNASQ